MAGTTLFAQFVAHHSGEAAGILALVSFGYLLLICLVAYLGRSLEFKLIGLGLLTGVLAVWVGQLAGAGGISVQAGPGQPGGMGVAVGTAESAGTLGRVAVLLVLGGIGLLFWNRWAIATTPARPEEAIRADRL